MMVVIGPFVSHRLKGETSKMSRQHTEDNEQLTESPDKSKKQVSIDALEQLKEEMLHLPMSELRDMQEKLGLKAFQKLRQGLATGKRAKNNKVFKRLNKNRPIELSARKQVPHRVITPQVKEKIVRDPRFDDLSGEFDEKIFKHNYEFVSDIRIKEKEELKKMIYNEKETGKRSQMKKLLKRMEQQEADEKKKEAKERREKERKKEEMQKVKEGKKPYFLKKGEKRALEDSEHKKELEKSGKLQKYMERKSKKEKTKEKKRQAWTTRGLEDNLL